jgi:hypothetical protein
MPEDKERPIEKEPYRFENGKPYVPPEKEPEPFVPDQGFDAPA